MPVLISSQHLRCIMLPQVNCWSYCYHTPRVCVCVYVFLGQTKCHSIMSFEGKVSITHTHTHTQFDAHIAHCQTYRYCPGLFECISSFMCVCVWLRIWLRFNANLPTISVHIGIMFWLCDCVILVLSSGVDAGSAAQIKSRLPFFPYLHIRSLLCPLESFSGTEHTHTHTHKYKRQKMAIETKVSNTTNNKNDETDLQLSSSSSPSSSSFFPLIRRHHSP